MKMIPVRSSAIRAVGYDPATQRMRITFVEGHGYDFCHPRICRTSWRRRIRNSPRDCRLDAIPLSAEPARPNHPGPRTAPSVVVCPRILCRRPRNPGALDTTEIPGCDRPMSYSLKNPGRPRDSAKAGATIGRERHVGSAGRARLVRSLNICLTGS
jgi:hypothetical protein